MSGWRRKQVKDLGEIITGRTPSTARKDFYDGDYNLISPTDLDNGKYICTAHKKLTKLGFEECRALPKGTVLVGCIGNIGKIGIVGNDQSATNQQINAIICNDEHDPEFVYYCFRENRERLKEQAVKTTVPILNKNNFGNFEANVPPLPEQKNIAHVLSIVQYAIEAQERIIQITTELKQALMQKLFSEGLRGEPQKETEIGLVPESWEVCTVGDVAMIQSGGTPSRENPDNWLGGTIPWVKTGEINYRTIIDTEEKITQHGLNNSSARLFSEGTLLMAMYGQGVTRGRVGILGVEAATNQACAAIIPKRKEEVVTEYLYFYFQHSYESLRRMGHGANQKNMNADLIRAFPLALPSPKEQEEVTSIMKSHDNRLQQTNLKRLCLTDLFASLLHDLMGGRFLLSSDEQSC